MTSELAAAYKSGSQMAGRVSEAWGADNFYCPNCSSPKLDWLKPGTKANDYQCPTCKFWFQLKSQKTRIAGSVTDGAYDAMMDAIAHDRTPNFFFLHYDLATWTVRNLLLIPHFAFPPSAIIQRKPLSATARRAGWVGCNFDLTRIPAEGRIAIIRTCATPSLAGAGEGGRRPGEGQPGKNHFSRTLITSPEEVRRRFQYIKPLARVDKSERGWTLDVLNAIHTLGRTEFTNSDAYTLADALAKLHPGNRHIRDKIRQQLQVLRDAGLLIHVDRGVWRLP